MNPEPWVLLQLSTAAGAEVMHGAARLLHPATLLLSGHGRHKGKDVCSNLSQKRGTWAWFISWLQTAQAVQALTIVQLNRKGSKGAG